MATTLSNVEALAKIMQNVDEKVNTYPSTVKLAPLIKKDKRLNREYRFSVNTQQPGGGTFAGGSTAGTAFALSVSAPMTFTEATVTGSTYVLPQSLAVNAIQATKASGQSALKESLRRMKAKSDLAQEITLFYGQTDLGAIYSEPSTGVFKIHPDDWAPHLWRGLVGELVDVYDDADLTTKINTNADLQITNVDMVERTVTVSGNATDITNITPDTTKATAHRFAFRDSKDNQSAGLSRISQNTGTLYGIDASTVPAWRSLEYDMGATAPTVANVRKAFQLAIGNGCDPNNSVFICSHLVFDDIADALGARVQYQTQDAISPKDGAKSIHILSSGSHRMKLMPHEGVKPGEGFILNPKDLCLVGIQNRSSFSYPGMPGNFKSNVIVQEQAHGVQVRSWWDCGLVHRHPAHMVRVHNMLPTGVQ